MGTKVSKLCKYLLSKKVPSKIPHGCEGRGGSRDVVLVVASNVVVLRTINTTINIIPHGREVVYYNNLL